MQDTNPQATALFRAIDQVRRAWHSLTPCKSLSKSQFGTLMAICHCEKNAEDAARPVTVSSLAGFMRQSLPALSQRLRVLEELHYVERLPDARDHRVIGVRLTDEGRAILETAHSRFDAVLTEALAYLGPADAETLILLLGKLAKGLERAVSPEKEGL